MTLSVVVAQSNCSDALPSELMRCKAKGYRFDKMGQRRIAYRVLVRRFRVLGSENWWVSGVAQIWGE